MKTNEVVEALKKALLSTAQYHQLDENEIEKLAIIMSAVSKSDTETRSIFYSAMLDVSKVILQF
jgi:hypothetical protein